MKSMKARQADIDAHARATEAARRVRAEVGEQLRDLVIESDHMGSQGELVGRVQAVGEVQREVLRARARQQQAREMGLPLAPAVGQEHQALDSLRSAVMTLGAACGRWAAAMDYEKLRESHGSLNGEGGVSDGG